MSNKITWTIMLLGALGVGLYAIASATLPNLRVGFVQDMIATNAEGSILHFLGGAVVIIIGAMQFNARFRSTYPMVHRWCGRIYVIGALIGGLAGFYLAFYSNGGVVAHWGFGTLAVCWIAATLVAYQHIRSGNVRVHQDWMIRSYALTLAAVTLRIYLPLAQISGISFEDAYPAIAWVCWVPNILIAEWFLIPISNRRRVLS